MTTPEITVIQPKTAHQIEGWAIEVYRKDAPHYAVVAILRGSRVLSLRRNKCQAIFATPEAAIAAWNTVDWEVTIDKNGAVYRVVGRRILGFHKHLITLTPEVKPAPVITYRELEGQWASWDLSVSATARVRAAYEKKQAKVSPALATPAEHVIALPTPAMALESYTVNRGAGRIYRATCHNPRQWSIEVWSADDGEWKHVRNHASPDDVGMTIVTLSPAPPRPPEAPRPETHLVNRGNTVFRITRALSGRRWLVEQWKSPRGNAAWFPLLPCATEEQVDGLIGVVITPPVYTHEVLTIA